MTEDRMKTKTCPQMMQIKVLAALIAHISGDEKHSENAGSLPINCIGSDCAMWNQGELKNSGKCGLTK